MYAILIGYWFIFWQRFLRNPFLLSTSEMATTNFPHWMWMGRKWRATDDLYYKYPASIPFLSMWYIPNVFFAYISRFLCIDNAFKLYTYFVLSHYLLASFIAYKVLGLFGAITLTYAGYCIKPQTPSFVYTMAWMPGMLIPGWFGIFSCFMAITGGYWPILIYFMPLAAFLNPYCLLGGVLALPQIIPFMRYWKKSVRSGEKVDRELGRIPWWKLKDLFWPTNNVAPTNGIHYPEVAMFCGIACILVFHLSLWWIPLIVSLMICVGLLPTIQRIPSRSLYLVTFSFVLLSAQGYHLLPKDLKFLLLIVQSYLLYNNSTVYPSFPFSQWWDKPSKRSQDYTGYLKEVKLHDYRGAFALKC